MRGGTPYTVHRTPYSGSPGAWPAPLARILPFRRYTPKTPKTPPSPPLLLTPSPGELSAVRALSFLKLNFLTRPFSRPYIYFPPPNLPLPYLNLTLPPPSSNPPDSTTCTYTGPATLCFRSRPLLSGGRRREESERVRARVFPFFFLFFLLMEKLTAVIYNDCEKVCLYLSIYVKRNCSGPEIRMIRTSRLSRMRGSFRIFLFSFSFGLERGEWTFFLLVVVVVVVGILIRDV